MFPPFQGISSIASTVIRAHGLRAAVTILNPAIACADDWSEVGLGGEEPSKVEDRRHQSRSRSAWLSLDYLGGAREQRRGHLKVECPGGFEVQNKVEFYRSLHGKITRPFAFEKAVDV